ncbi:hypothetical protein [Delftia acidovorans]|uniref:hypothetical protein n=1 Tax=Delftia acidovorans TaxID=80866 RepID=UPI002FDDFCA0
MPYTSLQEIENLATTLANARALPDGHPAKDLQIATLELRLQQSIEELEAGGATGEDPCLVSLRSL